MSIMSIVDNYKNNKIGKEEYADYMFKKYEELLDYTQLLQQSDTSKIVIDEKDVLFCITNKDYYGNQYKVTMKMWEKDMAAVPATITSFGSYEKQELMMASKLIHYLPKEAVMMDVGANLGWYSLNMKIQYPRLSVIAFEPISETYKKMCYNFTLNNLEVESYNIGLCNDSINKTFYYDTTASGASSMRDLRGLDTTTTEMCKMERMDDVMKKKNIGGLDFVKCDVEGSELFVYQGGIDSISTFKPIVFSEMLRKWSAKYDYHPNDIIDLFQGLGYGCYVIGDNCTLRTFNRVTDETTETNYFFLHREKHNLIIKEIVNE